MAKTFIQIEQQIAKLQKEAQALKAKEIPGVVKRIKDAIDHYGLTTEELFGSQPGRAAPTRKAASTRRRSEKKPPAPAKYQDGAGNKWSGHGKRPNWFKQAIASGKTREDLAVKP